MDRWIEYVVIGTLMFVVVALCIGASPVKAEEFYLKCGNSNFSAEEPFNLSWLEEDLCEDLNHCGTNADISELSRYIDEITALEEQVTTLRRRTTNKNNEIRTLKRKIISLKAQIIVLKRRIK
jgi:hypothetical protein